MCKNILSKTRNLPIANRLRVSIKRRNVIRSAHYHFLRICRKADAEYMPRNQPVSLGGSLSSGWSVEKGYPLSTMVGSGQPGIAHPIIFLELRKLTINLIVNDQ